MLQHDKGTDFFPVRVKSATGEPLVTLLAVRGDRSPPCILAQGPVPENLVKQPRDWVRYGRQEGQDQVNERGHGRDDAQLVWSSKDGAWNDLTEDQDKRHRHDHGDVARHKLVQKQGKGLVRQRIE
eukprot:scaffold7506_cov286-Pinguiococcus_pyrenoidosus.AAC.7